MAINFITGLPRQGMLFTICDVKEKAFNNNSSIKGFIDNVFNDVICGIDKINSP